jgi:hypothetical protein
MIASNSLKGFLTYYNKEMANIKGFSNLIEECRND